jgi:hypothetical protein
VIFIFYVFPRVGKNRWYYNLYKINSYFLFNTMCLRSKPPDQFFVSLFLFFPSRSCFFFLLLFLKKLLFVLLFFSIFSFCFHFSYYSVYSVIVHLLYMVGFQYIIIISVFASLFAFFFKLYYLFLLIFFVLLNNNFLDLCPSRGHAIQWGLTFKRPWNILQ